MLACTTLRALHVHCNAIGQDNGGTAHTSSTSKHATGKRPDNGGTAHTSSTSMDVRRANIVKKALQLSKHATGKRPRRMSVTNSLPPQTLHQLSSARTCRGKAAAWTTYKTCSGWAEVQDTLQKLASIHFPGGDWKQKRMHATAEGGVAYYFKCAFANSDHKCPFQCRILIAPPTPAAASGTSSCYPCTTDLRPAVHKNHEALVQLERNGQHGPHTGAQQKGAHLVWVHACTLHPEMRLWRKDRITTYLVENHVSVDLRVVQRCKKWSELSMRRGALATAPSGMTGNDQGALFCAVEAHRLEHLLSKPSFDKHSVYIVPGSFIHEPPLSHRVPGAPEITGPCLVFTSFNLALNAARAAHCFGADAPGPVAQIDHTFKVCYWELGVWGVVCYRSSWLGLSCAAGVECACFPHSLPPCPRSVVPSCTSCSQLYL